MIFDLYFLNDRLRLVVFDDKVRSISIFVVLCLQRMTRFHRLGRAGRLSREGRYTGIPRKPPRPACAPRGGAARLGRLFKNLLGTPPAWKALETL